MSRLNNDPCSSCGGQIPLCDGCAIVTPSREWIGDAKIFATDAIGALSKRDPHEFLAFVGSSENALILANYVIALVDRIEQTEGATNDHATT